MKAGPGILSFSCFLFDRGKYDSRDIESVQKKGRNNQIHCKGVSLNTETFRRKVSNIWGKFPNNPVTPFYQTHLTYGVP